MKKGIKEFWNEHKKGLLIGAAVAGGVVASAILIRKGVAKNVLEKIGAEGTNRLIAWNSLEDEKLVNLERVKEILDLNANNSAAFAIFREGPNPEGYGLIALSKGLIMHE